MKRHFVHGIGPKAVGARAALSMALTMCALPATAQAQQSDDAAQLAATGSVDVDVQQAAALSEKSVYDAIISLKSSTYPEGMRWTNENGYAWRGGIYSAGYGCVGFAFAVSDAAFGDLPAHERKDGISYDNIHIGDILRINGDTHSVVVLEKRGDSITLAEGNYNSSIHWGRTYPAAKIAQADYVISRYPLITSKANIVDPTCEGDGSYDLVTYCSLCGARESSTTYTTRAKGHTWGKWSTALAPTCTNEGQKQRVCETCGKVESASLKPTGHKVVEDAAVSATTTTTGLSKGTHCGSCGVTLVAQEIIPMLPPTKQPIRASVSHKTLSAEALRKQAIKTSIRVRGAAGPVTFKAIGKGNKHFSVSKQGVVTFRRGTKRGRYTIAVTAGACRGYLATTKSVTVKVR